MNRVMFVCRMAVLVVAAAIRLPSVVGDPELLQVQAVWRHGQRNPGSRSPVDLNVPDDFPQGLGQLTLKGMEQLFQVGVRFRRRYMEETQFLPAVYRPTQVYMESTDVDRTKVSAAAFLLGLYTAHAQAGVSFPNSTDWLSGYVPVPLHTVSGAADAVFLGLTECPRYETLKAIVDNSTGYQTYLRESAPFLQLVTNHTGFMNPEQMLGVLDSLPVEKQLGLPVPSWSEPYLAPMDAFFGRWVAFHTGLFPLFNGSADVQKELAGFFTANYFRIIVSRLAASLACASTNATPKQKNCPEPRFYGLSCHDQTLIGLFQSLGFNTTDPITGLTPQVSANVIFELWRLEQEAFVKVLYFPNSSVQTPTDISAMLPECPHNLGCPLQYLQTRSQLLTSGKTIDEMCNIACLGSQMTFFALALFMLSTWIVRVH